MPKQFNSTKKKSASRLLAVQSLYIREVDPETDDDLLTAERLATYVADNEHVHLNTAPDVSYMNNVVEAVLEHQDSIDASIQHHLQGNRSYDRMLPVLKSILRAAVAEMSEKPDISEKIIISEYVNIAYCFLDEKDAKFANRFLDEMAQSLRS